MINQTFLNTPVEEAVALILKETPYRIIRFQDAFIIIPGDEEAFLIDGVIIQSHRADHNVTSNQMSLVEVNREAIKRLTLTTGTKDIIRSLTLIPGVKSAGEFGSDIIVRGGGSDQNLILIEGAPVFNTAYIFGLLSAVNADGLESAVLYKGNIPARSGERVSSVMDLKIRQDNDEKFWGTGGIGIIDSRLTLGIPVNKKKLSVLIGGRTTYSDYPLHMMPDAYLKNSLAYFF